jgi:hypothetical protein
LDGLGMNKVGILYGHLEYITAIWNILWPFSGNLVYIFSLLLFYCVKKNLATLVGSHFCCNVYPELLYGIAYQSAICLQRSVCQNCLSTNPNLFLCVKKDKNIYLISRRTRNVCFNNAINAFMYYLCNVFPSRDT